MAKRKREAVMIDDVDDDDEPQVVSESVSTQCSVREARRREKRVRKAADVLPEVGERNDGDDGAGPSASMITEGSSNHTIRANAQAGEDGEIFFIDLGGQRRATVKLFKGHVYVDFREFFGRGDDLRPGKKGLVLTADQWKVLKDNVDVLDAYVTSTKE